MSQTKARHVCDGAIGTTHYIVGFSPLTIDFHILCGIMLPRCKIRIYPRFMTRHVCRYSLKGRYINFSHLWIPVMSMIYYNDFLPNKK